MKTVAAIISALLALGQGVIWFGFALLVLNGFSGRESDPAFVVVGIVALAAVIASAFVGSGITSHLLVRKPELKGWAVLMAVVLTTTLAAVMLFCGLLVAVAIASGIRN